MRGDRSHVDCAGVAYLNRGGLNANPSVDFVDIHPLIDQLATLEFWVRFPNERNQGKQAHPVLKYRVPQGSHQGKQAHPVLKYRVPQGSQPRHGWGLQIPRWLGSDPLSAWWLGLAPATLEFWVRFPNERNQGNQAHPVLKYRVPHGSHIHTGLGSSSIIAHVVHSPPPPPANSFVIGPAVINTHICLLSYLHLLLPSAGGRQALTFESEGRDLDTNLPDAQGVRQRQVLERLGFALVDSSPIVAEHLPEAEGLVGSA